jgi:glycosyltransferase involved in cell wall biosynthesis
MRVLLVNYEFPPIGAGAGNAMANIARCLAASGTEVFVLTARWGNLPGYEQRDGYTIRRVPAMRRCPDRCSPLEMLTFVLGGLAPALAVGRSWRPDVACAFFGVPSGPLALLLRRLYGVPYLVSLRGGDVPGFLGDELATLHRLTWPITRAVWRGSSGLIANSQGLAELALRAWPGITVDVIPNGVDVETYRPPERTRPASPVRLLCVGRLARQKGIPYLLEGLARTHSSAVLRLVGDGPERSELEHMASTLGLAGRVEFVGWVDRAQLPDHYQWADAFVLPSLEEGMANVILEALAAGLPIVTTDIYGNRELIDPGRNGLLVPPADSGGIARAIDLLVATPALLRVLGNGSRATALGRRWDGVAERYRQALALAAARPAAPVLTTPGRVS